MGTNNPNTDNKYSLTVAEQLRDLGFGLVFGGTINLDKILAHDPITLETVLANGLYLALPFGFMSYKLENSSKAIHATVITYAGVLLGQGIAEFALYTVESFR